MSASHDLDFITIRTQLKECDKDRYLSSLFNGGVHSQSLWTLYAFACELAKIPHLVQETMLGKMRLQWWHDIITEAKEEAVKAERKTILGHPVADQLKNVIIHYNLDTNLFYQIIEARHHDLETPFFTTDQDFADYHDAIWGNLYRIAYQIITHTDKISQSTILSKNPIFKAAGLITGQMRFLNFADRQALNAHKTLVFEQVSKLENNQDREINTSFEAYKAFQIKQISMQLESFSELLASSHSLNEGALNEGALNKEALDDRVFLPLALVPHRLLAWQKAENLTHIPDAMNPLRHFYILWRASSKGLLKFLDQAKRLS